MENYEARFLVKLYFQCKNANCYPMPGGPMQQTNFIIELFDYMDEILAETKQRRQDEEQKKPTKIEKR